MFDPQQQFERQIDRLAKYHNFIDAALVEVLLDPIRAGLGFDIDESYKQNNVIVTMTSPRYWPGTYVLCKMMRHTGCDLPINIWYQDHHGCPTELRGDGISLHNITEFITGAASVRSDSAGVQYLRSLVLLNTGARRVFWIGSDAYPIVNITNWFDFDDHDRAVFWKEVPGGQKFNPLAFGLKPETEQSTWSVQGDTILIDIKQSWQGVLLTQRMLHHADYFFRYSHGDQGIFRAAWALLGWHQHSFSTECVNYTQYPFIYLHRGPDLQAGIVHRVGSKWPLDPDAPCKENERLTFHRSLPLEEAAFGYYQEFLRNHPELISTARTLLQRHP